MGKFLRWVIAGALVASLTIGIGIAQTPTGLTATWTWSAPTTNSDGSAISGTLTYQLYVGTAGANSESGTPAYTGTATSATTSGYSSGQTVTGFVIACYNGTVGPCSAKSAEASYTFPLPAPAAPTSLKVQ
jgi:hypothetical protein